MLGMVFSRTQNLIYIAKFTKTGTKIKSKFLRRLKIDFKTTERVTKYERNNSNATISRNKKNKTHNVCSLIICLSFNDLWVDEVHFLLQKKHLSLL